MTTTRYLCAAGLILAAALILTVSLKYWPRIAPFLQRRPKPQMHEGATEKFGAELHALKDAPVAPELISDTEMDLQWALVWHDCEHRWQAEVARIFAEAQAELERPRTFDEVRELVAA